MTIQNTVMRGLNPETNRGQMEQQLSMEKFATLQVKHRMLSEQYEDLLAHLASVVRETRQYLPHQLAGTHIFGSKPASVKDIVRLVLLPSQKIDCSSQSVCFVMEGTIEARTPHLQTVARYHELAAFCIHKKIAHVAGQTGATVVVFNPNSTNLAERLKRGTTAAVLARQIEQEVSRALWAPKDVNVQAEFENGIRAVRLSDDPIGSLLGLNGGLTYHAPLPPTIHTFTVLREQIEKDINRETIIARSGRVDIQLGAGNGVQPLRDWMTSFLAHDVENCLLRLMVALCRSSVAGDALDTLARMVGSKVELAPGSISSYPVVEWVENTFMCTIPFSFEAYGPGETREDDPRVILRGHVTSKVVPYNPTHAKILFSVTKC